mmetsp:Transcript_24160/g.57121  ORF Transcript_24160/g.57121 Transcript_24160/m.57121 type:complete len:338 (-) Transcript_24160:48-1061(-)
MMVSPRTSLETKTTKMMRTVTAADVFNNKNNKRMFFLGNFVVLLLAVHTVVVVVVPPPVVVVEAKGRPQLSKTTTKTTTSSQTSRKFLSRLPSSLSSQKNPRQSSRQTQQQSTSTSTSVFERYLRSCEERPFLTKGVTAGCIAAMGDIMAQYLEYSLSSSSMSSSSSNVSIGDGDSFGIISKTTIMMFFSNMLNVRRVTTFFLCGALFSGPFVHIWYGYVAQFGRSLKTKFGPNFTTLQEVLSQLLLDQTVGVVLFFPLYLIVYDMIENVVIYGQFPSFEQALTRCHIYIRQVITMQYRIFPLASLINFSFVPEQLRVLFSNSVSLFWNIYLCSLVA